MLQSYFACCIKRLIWTQIWYSTASVCFGVELKYTVVDYPVGINDRWIESHLKYLGAMMSWLTWTWNIYFCSFAQTTKHTKNKTKKRQPSPLEIISFFLLLTWHLSSQKRKKKSLSQKNIFFNYMHWSNVKWHKWIGA